MIFHNTKRLCLTNEMNYKFVNNLSKMTEENPVADVENDIAEGMDSAVGNFDFSESHDV